MSELTTEAAAPPPRRAGEVTRLDRRLHRSYRQLFAAREWLWRRVTPTGALIFWGMVAAASFTDAGQTLSHQMLAFLACLTAAGVLWLRGPRPRLAVTRRVPPNATVGTPFVYGLHLRNLGRTRQRGVEFREGVPDPRPSVEEFARLEEPGERERNWFDRRYRFYRWRWICERNTRAHPQPVPLPPLNPREEIDLRLELTPTRRGRLTLGGALASRTDPFGLLRRPVRVQETPVSLVVFPRRFRLPSLLLPGLARRLHNGGIAMAGSVGDSEDFVSVREYRPGDPLRRIHWAGWARTQKPVVKEFQEEFFVRHALLLDTFGGGPEADAFEDAVSLAASFACTVDESESLLDLMFVGDRAYVFTAGRGLAHSGQMLEVLASVGLRPEGHPGALEGLVLRHAASLSGCVILLLGWDAARQRLRERIESFQVPTLTFVIASHPAPAGVELPPRTYWTEVGRIEEALLRLAS